MNIVQKKDLKELIYEKVNDGDLYRLYICHMSLVLIKTL